MQIKPSKNDLIQKGDSNSIWKKCDVQSKFLNKNFALNAISVWCRQQDDDDDDVRMIIIFAFSLGQNRMKEIEKKEKNWDISNGEVLR